jgi:hypothetical protein
VHSQLLTRFRHFATGRLQRLARLGLLDGVLLANYTYTTEDPAVEHASGG